MQPNKHFLHYKLLTATKQFSQVIAAADPDCSPLHARLVYSWLAYRSRLGGGASARDISLHTGLHPATVSAALLSLKGLIQRTSNTWVALEPPAGQFFSITPTRPEHWSDHFAYMMIFLPAKGAKVSYTQTVRRFGLSHALIWSFLFRQAKQNVVRRFTVAGAAALFDLDKKTVKAVLDDLLWLKMIERMDLGRSSEITLLPLTEAHAALFRQKPPSEKKKIEPQEKKPRPAAAPYKYRGDDWDYCRRFCEGLMPQEKAEAAISKAISLGDEINDFEALFGRAKDRHDQNILTGKVSTGDFGKYLNACLDHRLRKQAEQEEAAVRLMREEAYFSSPEYAQKRADEAKAAAADPLHPLFNASDDDIFNRVRYCLTVTNIKRELHRNITDFLRPRNYNTQEGVDASGELRRKIIGCALAKLNGYYLQPERASIDDFRKQIQTAFEKVCGTAYKI